MKSTVLLITAALLSGCATGHLYLMQGPLSAQAPAPIYNVKMDYGDGISATLAHGDACHGTWLDVVKEDPSARDLAAEWDLVYGKGYFLANVLGHVGIAHALLTCTSGATLKAEFDSAKGVAKDNTGNVFRLKF